MRSARARCSAAFSGRSRLTNDEAKRLISAGERGPLWVVAGRQTRGRDGSAARGSPARKSARQSDPFRRFRAQRRAAARLCRGSRADRGGSRGERFWRPTRAEMAERSSARGRQARRRAARGRSDGGGRRPGVGAMRRRGRWRQLRRGAGRTSLSRAGAWGAQAPRPRVSRARSLRRRAGPVGRRARLRRGPT